MKHRSYKFTSELRDEKGEVLESCEVQAYSEGLNDIMQTMRTFLIASGFAPEDVREYLGDY